MVANVDGTLGISDRSWTQHLFRQLVAQPEKLLLLCSVRPSLRVRPSALWRWGSLSSLAHAETWLRTVSSCTAEEVPWAPSVCSISSPKDGWAGVNAHANALLSRMRAANPFMCSWNSQWVASIDMAANDEANENVIVTMSESFTEQAAQVSWQRIIAVL